MNKRNASSEKLERVSERERKKSRKKFLKSLMCGGKCIVISPCMCVCKSVYMYVFSLANCVNGAECMNDSRFYIALSRKLPRYVRVCV